MPTVSANHILVQSIEEVQLIQTQLTEGARFEDLARQYSKCPSGQNGGALGFFTNGQMVKPFEDAAFGLDIGQISGPVQTQFGFHLIKRTA